MKPEILYILIAVLALIIIIVGIFYAMSASSSSSINDEVLRNLVLSQKSERKDLNQSSKSVGRGEVGLLASQGNQIEATTKDIYRATLLQKIYFAEWTITPGQYKAIKYSVTAILTVGATFLLEIPLIICVFLLTPKFIDAILARAINKKFLNFDRDFPDFLMTIVSRLKSGMNILQAMQSATTELPSDSILKREMSLLNERIKLGYSEEKAIGSFAENVPHPEIELFTQVVILNKRVGGNFAATLERLAKQIRKRQDFRRKAVSSVAEQKGGGVFIFLIMTGLMFMVSQASPEITEVCFNSKMGRLVSQFGASLSIMGFYLIRVITSIRV